MVVNSLAFINIKYLEMFVIFTRDPLITFSTEKASISLFIRKARSRELDGNFENSLKDFKLSNDNFSISIEKRTNLLYSKFV